MTSDEIFDRWAPLLLRLGCGVGGPTVPGELRIKAIPALPEPEPIGCIIRETMTWEEFAKRYPELKASEPAS